MQGFCRKIWENQRFDNKILLFCGYIVVYYRIRVFAMQDCDSESCKIGFLQDFGVTARQRGADINNRQKIVFLRIYIFVELRIACEL